MMRMLGAPPRRVAAMVALEALWLAALGAMLGLALGQGLTHVLGLMLKSERSVSLSGTLWSMWEWSIPVLALALALLSSASGVARLPAGRTRLLQAPR